MKKLCALLLSVIMAASLAVPAFADGPDGPPTPADLGIIGGADGPTAITTSGPIGGGQNWMNTNPKFDDMDRQAYQAMLNQQKKALGGVPGQIGVMINGKYAAFSDAAPEVIDGRIMAPVRVLMEALGGEVSTYGSDIRCRLDGVTFIFTIGSAEMVVEPEQSGGGCELEAGVLDMGCEPYIKGGRTYVPVRSIGEALGYTVGWDNDFKTVVCFDADALAEEIDQDFTILNRMLSASAPMEEGKNYSAQVKGDLTFTAFDTLNGNQTYTADISSRLLMNTEAVSGTYSITMSDRLIDMLIGQYELEGDDAETLRTILKGLNNMDVIMTEEGLAWLHAPVLDELGGKENIWCGLPMEENAAIASFTGIGSPLTIGTVMALAADANSVMSYSEVRNTVELLSGVMGDKCFTTSNGTSTLIVDADRLDPTGELGVKGLFKELKLTLKVDRRGGAELTCRMETASQSGMPSMRLSMNCTQSSQSSDMTVEAHAANLGELQLTLSATRQAASQKPMTEPPAGAAVVDAPELLNP